MVFEQFPEWDIQVGTDYGLTVGQPVATRSGVYSIQGFKVEEDGLLVALQDDQGQASWYDLFAGVWIGPSFRVHDENYDVLKGTHSQWVRVIRSLVAEKLSPDEIVKAEKLGDSDYKLVHRYTGGWMLSKKSDKTESNI